MLGLGWGSAHGTDWLHSSVVVAYSYTYSSLLAEPNMEPKRLLVHFSLG